MVKGKSREPRPERHPRAEQKIVPPLQVPPTPDNRPGREATPVIPPVIEPDPDGNDPKAV